VTGGAGFIGSHFVRTSLAGDHGDVPDLVTVLDKLTYSGNLANLGAVQDDPRLRFVRGDVCDPSVCDDLVSEVDAVVHFAAESHVDRSIQDAREFVLTNVVGTQMLLDAALRRGVERFVHVSTDEVYGSISTGSWTETHPLSPNSPYAASKAGSDLLALAYARTHRLPVMVTRCSNTYGPFQFPEKLIPLFVTNLLDEQDVPLYGDGLNVRDWLHVDDHCRAISLVLAGGRPGEVYNIGGGTELSNREVTGMLLKALGQGWERVIPVGDRQAHDRRCSVDARKIRTELGFTPRVPFAEGLADTVDWYRRRRDWWEPLRIKPQG